MKVSGPGELEGAFSAMTRERVGALSVMGDTMFRNELARILALAAQGRLPATYIWREAVGAGGLADA